MKKDKLVKQIISVLLCFSFVGVLNAAPNFSEIFKNQAACFMLYDLNQHQLKQVYSSQLCKTQYSPNSTFKIALSLMAFDSHVITPKTVFKWSGEDYSLPFWNQNQTPKTWLQYSVVWVSQQITPELGMNKITHYLKSFDYGNEDFKGDPGKNNGLSHAWLDSSLKISPTEQMKFIGKLVQNKLPVSQTAMKETQANLYLETSENGWQLYGKTGSGSSVIKGVSVPHGWFVGWVQKQGQIYLVVLRSQDLIPLKSTEYAGLRAKNAVLQILKAENLY